VIQFGSAPENADTLFAAVQRTIDALRTTGPTAEELASALEQQRRQQEVSVRENGYWLSGVLSRLRTGVDPRQLLDAPQIIGATTAAAVRDAAATLVDPAQFVRIVLLPAP
jgi:zinc protease